MDGNKDGHIFLRVVDDMFWTAINCNIY